MNAAGDGRAGQQLAGLVRLAQVLADARSLTELAERACEEARFAFGARGVSLSQLEPEHGVLRTLVTVGERASGQHRLPTQETYQIADFPLLATMVDQARPWLLQLADESAPASERALLASLDATSALAAPVLAQGRVWGALFAIRAGTDDPFHHADVAFAQAFAGMVSAGLAQVEHLLLVERLAYHDALTGLGNRRLVEDELDRALDLHRTGSVPVTVVMADLNRLKQANDDYGHDAGDRALVFVAHALSAACGRVPGAVAGRMGGDEFCAVLPGYPVSVGEALASAFLRGTTSAPFGVSVACGVASTEGLTGPVTRERLFALADGAQYEAKRSGAALPVLADPARQAERRRNRPPPRDGGSGLLISALDAVAGVAPARDGSERERLAAAVAAVAAGSSAVGWVLDRLDAGAAVPVMSAVPAGEVFLAAVPAPPGASWVRQARQSGTTVSAQDEEVPLAAVRGAPHLVVAAVGPWLAELMCASPPAPEVPAVLRAAMSVALTG